MAETACIAPYPPEPIARDPAPYNPLHIQSTLGGASTGHGAPTHSSIANYSINGHSSTLQLQTSLELNPRCTGLPLIPSRTAYSSSFIPDSQNQYSNTMSCPFIDGRGSNVTDDNSVLTVVNDPNYMVCCTCAKQHLHDPAADWMPSRSTTNGPSPLISSTTNCPSHGHQSDVHMINPARSIVATHAHGAFSSNTINGTISPRINNTEDLYRINKKDIDINPSNHAISDAIKAPVHDEHSSTTPGSDMPPPARRPSLWYEEEIDENLRWCFCLKSILHTGVSKFQEIALLDTQPFGKVLTLDGKMQSAEVDEWVYHECLVHPALLLHQSPENIFIMGGGEGSTTREVLRHNSIKKVVMCDIDEEVVKFCNEYLTINRPAFQSTKLELVINDARLELECRIEKFDIIVGDLADPLEWGPCYQLYSKGFYENVVKPKLNDDGIFVTQAGPAGVLSHKEVFTSIYNTLKQVFPYVIAYSAHVPSYADTWGWVMASNQPLNEISHHDEMDTRIRKRIKGELQYLDGATLHASTILNKTVRQSLASENHIYTEDSARFLYGHGRTKHLSTH